MKKIFSSLAIASMFLLTAGLASAHAVVKPAQAGIGAYQEFTLSVPSEKPLATTAVRLLIPDSIKSVTPNVKAGWKIEVKSAKTGNQVKDDDGMMVDETKVSEIDWTGGSIPAGERDTFVFQVQTPATPTTLQWKVYQTYADGSVISWDKDADSQPKTRDGKNDFSSFGPYSQTVVVDDLAASSAPSSAAKLTQNESNPEKLTLTLSVLALVFAAWAVFKKS